MTVPLIPEVPPADVVEPELPPSRIPLRRPLDQLADEPGVDLGRILIEHLDVAGFNSSI